MCSAGDIGPVLTVIVTTNRQIPSAVVSVRQSGTRLVPNAHRWRSITLTPSPSEPRRRPLTALTAAASLRAAPALSPRQ